MAHRMKHVARFESEHMIGIDWSQFIQMGNWSLHAMHWKNKSIQFLDIFDLKGELLTVVVGRAHT